MLIPFSPRYKHLGNIYNELLFCAFNKILASLPRYYQKSLKERLNFCPLGAHHQIQSEEGSGQFFCPGHFFGSFGAPRLFFGQCWHFS